jgi:hypothetical protein
MSARASIGRLVITFENVVCRHDKEIYKKERSSAKTPIFGRWTGAGPR